MLEEPGCCDKGDRDEGEEVFVSEDKELPLDGGETDMAHRQKVVYKGKGGKPTLG